jgi:hypothetical protein
MVTRTISGWKEIPTTSTPSGDAVPVVQDPTAIPWIVSSTEFPVKVLVTGSANVSVNVVTTIASFTATATDKNITRITGSSEFPGEWTLFLNAGLVETLFTSGGGSRNVIFELQNWELTATDVVDLKFEHGYTGKTPPAYATMWGY